MVSISLQAKMFVALKKILLLGNYLMINLL